MSNPEMSFSCGGTGFLNCAPAHNPQFRDAVANLVPNCLLHLWYRTCSSSAVRFSLRRFLSSLLLAISPARASEPWRGSMHGKLWSVTRSNGYDSSLSKLPAKGFQHMSLPCPQMLLSVSTRCVDWRDGVLCHSCALISLFVRAKFTQILQLLFACLLHSLPKQLLSSDVVEALDEFVHLASSCQHRILLKFRALLLTKS